MPRVTISGAACRQFTGGATEFEVEATNVRRLILELDRRFPGLGKQVEESMAVAIDGAIHDQPAYFQKVRPGCEIFFIPKLEGG